LKLGDISHKGGGIIGIENTSLHRFDAIVYNEHQSGWGFGSDNYVRSHWSFVTESTTEWIFVVATYEDNNYKLYINNTLLLETQSYPAFVFPAGSRFNIGLRHTPGCYFNVFYHGQIDDVGVWNRVLTEQEMTDLYNENNMVNCSNNLTITPASQSLQTGSTATFTASTSDTDPIFRWQSDFGQGFQTLTNYGNYSGVNTDTLSIDNVQLSNHLQAIRVISTYRNCVDTSNVAYISVADTAVTTIFDTTFISVTDTLLINTTITGLTAPNNVNTIKVYPNPANDFITIDYGNYTAMNGYKLRIENALGQPIFLTDITQQSDYLSLATWGGTGLYIVHILDPQGNTLAVRKIILQ
jgi:hypothetical protein